MKRHNQIAIALLAGGSLLAIAQQASAQAPAPATSVVEEVVVTGSRVIQNGNNMPTPVTVVTTESLQQTTPSTIVDGLNNLPVFAGGRTPTTNPGNGSQNNAFRTLNLRNLGATRTLVLFDGRRVPPTSPLGEVNADFVPSLLLQRVDVVTGGASAVYGSDAVSGVVNFITDRKFNGIKANASFGRSERGDADETRIGFAAGMPVMEGRGHIEGSYEYYNSPGVFSKLNREWGQKVYTVQGAGTAANPYRLVQNTRLTRTSFSGVVQASIASQNSGNPLRDMVFRQNGILSPFQHGAAIGSGASLVSGVESGGDGGYFYNASLQSLYQSDLAFGRFDYDVSDNVHFYGEVTAMASHNKNNHETSEVNGVTMSSSNAFLAPEYQQAMIAAGKNTFTFAKMLTQISPKTPETYTQGYMANFGLEGDLSGWKWDVSYVNSKNEQRTRLINNPNNGKLFAALDAVKAPNGQVVCNVTLTNPGLYPGCVPINLFGPTSESKEALAYVMDTTKYATKTSMNNFGAAITGSPFSLPAGEVGVAVSAEYRKLTYALTSNATTQPISCTGLRFNCTAATTQWQSNVLNPRTEVSQSVTEGALEVQAPILKDLPFVESLGVNGAVRYTDYDTSGKVTTWKIGGDWHINGDITLRATRSRDIRAPNLNELFAPRLVNPAGVTDVHTNLSGIQAPFITDPNPNLTPEEADTTTAGVVYRPSWLPRFSIAVDYYKIEIANAITAIQGQSIDIQNICEASNGTSSFCKLIERPLPFSDHSAANKVTAFYSSPQNAQVVNTNGVDFEANYNIDLFQDTPLGGNFAVRALASYQPELTTVQFPGAVKLDAAGAAGLPEWRVTVNAKYAVGQWSFDTQTRWHNKTGWNSNPTLIYAESDLPAVAVTNATVSYNFDRSQAFITVSNLFDQQPTPFGGTGGASSVPGLFGGFIGGEDTIGRFYTVGVRIRR